MPHPTPALTLMFFSGFNHLQKKISDSIRFWIGGSICTISFQRDGQAIARDIWILSFLPLKNNIFGTVPAVGEAEK